MSAELLALVDHTALKPETSAADVDKLCAEAIGWGVAAVCVNGLWVARASEATSSSTVDVCSVIGFPLGTMSPTSVAAEAVHATAAGAVEIDMVISLGPLMAGDDATVASSIAAVRAATDGMVLKVILESAALDDEQLRRACAISVGEGADFVKTSTGFHPKGGATVHAVQLIRDTVGSDIGVKASGGIRTLADAEAMVAAGANRLGMSSTAALALAN